MRLFALAFAGALGALARYGLSMAIYRWLGEKFTFGTLAVNLLGCLLVGLLMETAALTELIPPTWRLVATVGFLGAFTTFSTLSYETLRFFEAGAWKLGWLNLVANVGLGLPLTWVGFMSARMLFQPR